MGPAAIFPAVSKWVIRRHRLHEAAEALGAGTRDVTRLAVELGYCDQAHFIKDFKSIVGLSPTQYRKRVAAPPRSRLS